MSDRYAGIPSNHVCHNTDKSRVFGIGFHPVCLFSVRGSMDVRGESGIQPVYLIGQCRIASVRYRYMNGIMIKRNDLLLRFFIDRKHHIQIPVPVFPALFRIIFIIFRTGTVGRTD